MELLKEYEILRGEITENSRLVAAVFTANTTTTAAIYGWALGLNPQSGPVFLAPLAILIPSLFFIASQLESTTIISQYLRVVLEPQIKIQWQTNWYEIRRRKLLSNKSRKYIPAVSGLYGILSIVSFVLAYFHWQPHSLKIFYGCVVVAGAFLLVALNAIRRAFSMNFREHVASAWAELLAERARAISD